MKISIVIPVYNVGELLHKSVDSVLSQNQNDCEIIIVMMGRRMAPAQCVMST